MMTAQRKQPQTAADDNPEIGALPSDLDAEQATLGACMIDPEACKRAALLVRPEDFYRQAHEVIFGAIMRLHEVGNPVDMNTISSELRRLGKLDEYGGAEYLAALIEQVPTTSHVVRYARTVREKSVLRDIIKAAAAIQDVARDNPEDVTRCAAEAVERLRAIEKAALADDPDANLWMTFGEIAKQLGEVTWLWPSWLPNGYLTLIAGDVGVGKSKLALTLANAVVTGAPWPNGDEGPSEIGSAVYLDTEGAVGLQAFRAVAQCAEGVSRIYGITPEADTALMLDDPKTLALVEQKCVEVGDVKLVVADSLRAGMTGDENSSEFGQRLAPWCHLAQRLGVAVVILHHARKPSDGQHTMTIERLRGSSAITALPRIILGIDKPDEEDPAVRVVMLKNNFAAAQKPFGLRLTEIGTEPAATPQVPRPATKLTEAEEFLEELLVIGKRSVADILAEAEAQGITRSTLYNAKKRLRVVEMPDTEDWRRRCWGLPSDREAPA